MKIQFISHIRKGNKRGTGFFYIAKHRTDFFNLGERVEVNLFNKIRFYSKIVKHSKKKGIYIPRHIVTENILLDKKIQIQINKVKGFYTRIYSDGRIYIPQDIVKQQKFQKNDIVLIKAMKGRKIIHKKYSKIYAFLRDNRNQIEYTCAFGKKFYHEKLTFQIQKSLHKERNLRANLIIQNILKKLDYAFINKNSIIIFDGNKTSAIIPAKINFFDVALYLGAYFADGTKKGNSWGICASTFEQAKYYLKMHNFLVKDSQNLEFVISYTNIYNTNEDIIKRRLAKKWKKQADISVCKFRIKLPCGTLVGKWNQYGTLVVREHKQIVLDFYNNLLKLLIKEILLKQDKKLAIDFICGVMEGDGSTPAKKRGHVTISTNKNEVHILEKILQVAEIKFKMIKEGENKYTLRIGSLELLKHFQELKDKIFILYPQRRIKFLKRLKTVGAIKFLIENHKPTSWVKKWLKNNNFSDKNYRISKKGLKFSNFLLSAMKSARVE